MKLLQLALPDYQLKNEPDFHSIGLKVEEKIGEEFPNQWLAMRGISLADHEGKSAADLQALILEHGTDRYDPHRKGVHHEMDEKFGIELHAIALKHEDSFICPHYQEKAKEGFSALGGFFEDFNQGAILDRGYALRINFLLFYELDQLEVAPMKWTEHGPSFTRLYIEPMHASCFRFKDSAKKREALLGLLHLRE